MGLGYDGVFEEGICTAPAAEVPPCDTRMMHWVTDLLLYVCLQTSLNRVKNPKKELKACSILISL